MTVTIEIAVDIPCPAWIAARDAGRCGHLAATALGAVDLPKVVRLSIVLGRRRQGAGSHREWRGKDQPTNVLSFAALDDDDAPLVPGAPLLLGDVILAYETCAAEARDQGKPLADHFGHLVVHGVLHLLGYDHMDDEEAAEMESLETTLLAALGIPTLWRAIEA
jgi:probable rRNA maturation factor